MNLFQSPRERSHSFSTHSPLKKSGSITRFNKYKSKGYWENIVEKRSTDNKIVKYDKYKIKSYGENIVEKKVLTTKIVKIIQVKKWA